MLHGPPLQSALRQAIDAIRRMYGQRGHVRWHMVCDLPHHTCLVCRCTGIVPPPPQEPYELPLSRLALLDDAAGQLVPINPLELFTSHREMATALERHPRLRVLLLRHFAPEQVGCLRREAIDAVLCGMGCGSKQGEGSRFPVPGRARLWQKKRSALHAAVLGHLLCALHPGTATAPCGAGARNQRLGLPAHCTLAHPAFPPIEACACCMHACIVWWLRQANELLGVDAAAATGGDGASGPTKAEAKSGSAAATPWMILGQVGAGDGISIAA